MGLEFLLFPSCPAQPQTLLTFTAKQLCHLDVANIAATKLATNIIAAYNGTDVVAAVVVEAAPVVSIFKVNFEVEVKAESRRSAPSSFSK